MSARKSERDLLFGILALQKNLFDRDDLEKAIEDGSSHRNHSLGSILVEAGVLPPDDQDMIEQLVELHMRIDEGSTEQSLPTLGSLNWITDHLEENHSTEIVESLSQLATATSPGNTSATVPPQSKIEFGRHSTSFRRGSWQGNCCTGR